MKKLMMILSLGLIVGNSSAYEVLIKNITNEDVKVTLFFGGPGYCGERIFAVSRKSLKRLGTKGCCLKKLRIQADQPAGMDEGKAKTEAYGRSTGAGISCANNAFLISATRGGQVVVDRVKKSSLFE